MFAKFSRSWELVKASAGVLRSDKELLVFPAISVLASLLVMASFILPLFGLLNPGAEERWHFWVPALAQNTLMTRVLKGESLINDAAALATSVPPAPMATPTCAARCCTRPSRSPTRRVRDPGRRPACGPR